MEAEPAETERCLILGCTHTKVCHCRAKTDSIIYRKQIMDTFFNECHLIYTYIYIYTTHVELTNYHNFLVFSGSTEQFIDPCSACACMHVFLNQ